MKRRESRLPEPLERGCGRWTRRCQAADGPRFS
jgi:hypothetical protein